MGEEPFGPLFQPKSLEQLGECHGEEFETIYERHTLRFQPQYLVSSRDDRRFDDLRVNEVQHEVTVVATGVVSNAYATFESTGKQVRSKLFQCILPLKDPSFPTTVARDTLLHWQIHAASAHSVYDA